MLLLVLFLSLETAHLKYKKMDFANRFDEATFSTSVNISSFVMDNFYPIFHPKSIIIKFGSTVLLSIRDSDENNVPIFLPKR